MQEIQNSIIIKLKKKTDLTQNILFFLIQGIEPFKKWYYHEKNLSKVTNLTLQTCNWCTCGPILP